MTNAYRYLMGVALAVLIGAGCNLDGHDESTADALVQADKIDAIADARRAADPHFAAITGGQP